MLKIKKHIILVLNGINGQEHLKSVWKQLKHICFVPLQSTYITCRCECVCLFGVCFIPFLSNIRNVHAGFTSSYVKRAKYEIKQKET